MAQLVPPRRRKVKILATLGPASKTPEMIRALYFAGADAFRINMSHGANADRAALIALLLLQPVQKAEVVECGMEFGGSPLEAFDVDTKRRRMVTLRNHIRRDVLRHAGAAAYHHVRTNDAELMDSGHAANDGMIVN